jgi:CBS domain-containing protein
MQQEEVASVRQAAKKMKEEDVSSLVVVNSDNDNKPVGLVTGRDIVRASNWVPPYGYSASNINNIRK